MIVRFSMDEGRLAGISGVSNSRDAPPAFINDVTERRFPNIRVASSHKMKGSMFCAPQHGVNEPVKAPWGQTTMTADKERRKWRSGEFGTGCCMQHHTTPKNMLCTWTEGTEIRRRMM
ncbi:hypothetical protein O3P69_000616 [Scylla paramamosain]|uniref:Uncharacterized protein n=1 Tax=Scylla paramamosain TaxID=85552 RepID=A0AAW0UQ88_SCYPA